MDDRKKTVSLAAAAGAGGLLILLAVIGLTVVYTAASTSPLPRSTLL